MASPSSTVTDIVAAQIAELPEEKWMDLRGLVNCATFNLSQRLAKNPDSSQSSIVCESISHIGSGSYNHVYRLDFSDGTKLAASVSQDKEGVFCPEAKESEIATMKFVRESGMYPEVPVPEVFAWDTTFKNPVKAPYVLMDFVDGAVIDNSRVEKSDPFIHKFDVYPETRQLAIVKALARLKAALSRPVSFTQLGSIVSTTSTTSPTLGGYSIGPFMTVGQRSDQEHLGGPYDTPEEMWYALLERRMLHALQNWCSLETENIHDPDSAFPVNLTPRAFSEMFRFLTALIPHFKLPPPYNSLVLHHPDFAFRNILFDKASLSSGTPKVVGVVDWSGAQILPLMLTAIFPGDLFSNDTTPFRPLYKNPPERYLQSWKSVPYDWTSIGDPSKYPDEADEWEGNPEVDYKPALTVQVRRFYLRTYFTSCYASQMYALHGDSNLARATLYSDATYYLKFHEILCTDVQSWFSAEDWVRETYWRLRLKPPSTSREGGSNDGPPLVVGPNVYHGKVGKPIMDLRMFAEEADEWGKDESGLFEVPDSED